MPELEKKIIPDDLFEKSAKIKALKVTKDDLKKINSYTMKDVTAEDIFVFKLAMENNCVDRQFENVSDSGLEEMAAAFTGRPLIKNHDWSDVDNEVARIFDCEIEESDTEKNSFGNPVKTLIAKLYMVRTDTNKDLIAEIQAGIKKECSVGFSAGSAVCSICGRDNLKDGYCSHYPGFEYEGKTCTFELGNIKDAYEVSLVTVPAVKDAGVVKNMELKKKDISEKPVEESATEEPTEEPTPAPEPTVEADDISLAVNIAQAEVDLESESAFCSESKEDEKLDEQEDA